MKIFKELYFRGTKEELDSFVKHIGEYAVDDWELVQTKERWKEYLFFEYKGKEVDKARVSIYVGENILKGELRVGNIVPVDKNELSVKEYNDVLLKFYKDVIKSYKELNTTLDISEPSDDSFNPSKVISNTALKKLKSFCNNANKSTGSSHPYDQERWFNFVCQTVDDGKMFDSSTLANFLQDEDYWGKKKDGFIGVMGNFAWDEEHALQLAMEYENLCAVLKYYKKTRGL